MADRPRLLAARCSSCVFRPGNLMHLNPGRLADLVAENRARGTLLVCHQTLDYAVDDEDDSHPRGALCRGYFDAYAPVTGLAQVMERLCGPDWYDLVPPPTHTEEDPS